MQLLACHMHVIYLIGSCQHVTQLVIVWWYASSKIESTTVSFFNHTFGSDHQVCWQMSMMPTRSHHQRPSIEPHGSVVLECGRLVGGSLSQH